MKLPSIYTDLCSKQVFKNPTLSSKISPLVATHVSARLWTARDVVAGSAYYSWCV